MAQRPLAVVTGASTGIGYELAQCCAADGFDLVVVADEAQIEQAAARLREHGGNVTAVEANLDEIEGVEKLVAALAGRPVDALLANAGRGVGDAFLDQDFEKVKLLVDTNITGTLYLIHRIGRDMLRRNKGMILITGSIAGFMPGPFSAVYNGTKAFLNSFAPALRNELDGTGITVTCLMPGATETEFFARSGETDTKVGREEKADPADVARQGFEAMIKGEEGVITGWSNKLQVAMSKILPAHMVAEQHRKEAEPGSANR